MNISARRSSAKHVGLFFQLPGSRLLCALLASLLVLLPSLAAALPIDGHVVAGQATIQKVSPTILSIAQASDKAILNWNSFSIAGNEAVHFIQPSVSSIALNRVIGVDPSVILGQLQANGRIFLINPNGILFGAGAQINVGGLLATTLQTRDEDFMAGRYLFAQDPLKGLKTVVNRGTIHVSDNGYVVLMAPGVSNEGVIVANLGTTLLGSGQKLTLDLMGDGLIRYAINDKVLGQMTDSDGKPLSSAVSNSGTIQADGGQVILSARASGDVFSSVVNQSGVIRAQSLVNHGGVVQLIGGDETLVAATSAGAMRPVGDVSGAVINTGMIDVAAGAPNAAQGSVTMVGERVGQFGSIVATGAEGANGGEVVIASTTRTLLASGSTIDVSGIGHSSGGRLRVWSEQDTFFDGGATILARGGELGGNGGFIELSGKENLGYAGSVYALAPLGSAGTLLLDPRNITIATAGGVVYNPGVNNLFGNTPAADVIITPASINAAAANVVLQANNDITVTNAIAMINNGVGITMQAGRDILVNADVSTTNGNISITANDSSSILANRANGAAGDIIFGVGANLSSSTGNISLTIDPATAGNYAPGSITTARNLTTTTGNITLNSPNTVSLSGAVNAGSGTVSMNANSDGAGAQSFTMNAGSSITATNAVAVTVNAAGGGTGAATLRNINTGLGSLAVTTNPVGNTVGGGITQVAGSTITAGGGAQITTGNGNISLQNVTTNGNLLVSSRNTVTLIGAVNAGSGTVSMNANSDGAGAQNFTMNAGSSIATTNTGANAVQVIVNAPTGGTGAASLRGSITTGNGGTVTVSTRGQAAVGGNTTGGAITQGAVVTMNTGAAGTIALATGAAASNITLNTAGNDFTGTVGVSRAFNVALRDANALTLGASTISGTLGGTTGGALSQSGALNVMGPTSFTATAANTDIMMGTQANNFGGALSFGGTLGNFRDVSIRNINAGATVPAVAGLTALRNLTLTYNNAPVTLPALTLTAGGSLNVTAGGAITDSGNLLVPGTTTLVAGANDITLDNTNNFSTVGITSGNNVALTDINALVLAPSTVSGTLNVTTNGALTQSGALAVTGATTLAAGAANNITLNNSANNFSTIGITNGNNVALTDANALDLGASTISGTLNVTTNGAMTQSDALSVTGTTALATGAANDITLNNAANNLSTVGITSGNNVALTDVNAFDLGASTISGILDVTTNGAMTQSGALSITGTTALATGAANDITLNNAANNFSTVGITSGNNVALTDVNALTLNASTVSGNFSANAGVLTVGGTVASAGGALNLTAANSVTQLANLTAAGANSVTVTAGGPITMAAAATTTSGTGGINYAAGTDVTLGSLSTGGGVNVFANGGSVFSASGSGTNVTAGADSTLQAFNGVVGTSAAPVTVNVNPGTLSIRATTAVADISAFLTGTVLPSNTLMLLNVPPGLVCFNGCPVTGGTGGLAGLPENAFSTLAYLNPDAIVPTYYPQPSGSVLISDITSVYMPGTLVQPSPVSLSSGDPTVQSMGPKAKAGAS